MTETIRGAWAFLKKHTAFAALVGGFISATLGAVYWLAQGGLVAIHTSLVALNDPDVANTLARLPEYHQRVEKQLALILDRQVQLSDTLESFRGDNERIVDWAPGHSQRLTDAAGGCYAGEPCTLYMRGRRTQAGATCVLNRGEPLLSLTDGREYPVRFLGSPEQLGTEFKTLTPTISIPEFVPPGMAAVVFITYYSSCPFAAEGEILVRQTFRLAVRINERD